MSEEYNERMATNDTAHGGDCMTPEECEAIDHETTLQELAQAAVLDGILDASRKVRAGDDMLFAALRKAGVL